MKRVCFLFAGLLILNSISISAQLTPEQQKQVEQAQKQAEEAQKKAMEMMQNNPQYEEAMKMMKEAEEQAIQERKMEQVEEEKRLSDAADEQFKDFYWRNKVASDTNGQFSDWTWGKVEIGYYDGKGKRGQYGKIPYESYTILGNINSKGEVYINTKGEAETNRTISNGLFPQMHEINNDEVSYSNPEAPFLWTSYTLDILKDGQKIGLLYIGNSERTTHNQASPSDMKYGDQGYMLYWAYSGQACTVTYAKDDPAVRIMEGEAEKTVDQYTRVDLNLKPGWNLVKIEVNGNHRIGQRTRWKWKTYSTVDTMPSDARYYFKYD